MTLCGLLPSDFLKVLAYRYNIQTQREAVLFICKEVANEGAASFSAVVEAM